MPIPDEERDAAAHQQQEAAREGSHDVLLVAGPGTGKSSSIAERVLWLIQDQAFAAERIFAISFTRASTADLRSRIDDYCALAGVDSNSVRVSTVHSLALRLLRRAGRLARFPVSPLVLDEWEVVSIFNAELADRSGITPTRCNEIRRYHEAMWSTGRFDPPNYIPPDPPISDDELRSFSAFHGRATEVYSCVLPGELVRQCVEDIEAGLVDPLALLDIGHLIVDEYQDLNPFDQRFIDLLTERDVPTLIAGDDDQSIYSFRFASPAGIQEYESAHLSTSQHTLEGCLRCTPRVVGSANALISHYSPPSRIPKTLRSLYETADPPVPGVVLAWRFSDDRLEARAIARTCSDLIDADVAARQILILMSNSRMQARQLSEALTAADVLHEMPTGERFIDEDIGRALLALLRIACDPDDYVAHRTLLGVRPGVGPRTCRQIQEQVIDENRNYRDLFYGVASLETFGKRQRSAIESIAALLSEMVGWTADDSLPIDWMI